MKAKRFYMMIAALVGVVMLGRAESIQQVMTDIPEGVIPIVDRAKLYTLINNYDYAINKSDTVINDYEGKTYINYIDTDKQKISLQLTLGIEYVIIIESNKVYVMQNYCAPICTTQVDVYSMSWKHLKRVRPPMDMVFPFAQLIGGEVVWKENMPEEIETR